MNGNLQGCELKFETAVNILFNNIVAVLVAATAILIVSARFFVPMPFCIRQDPMVMPSASVMMSNFGSGYFVKQIAGPTMYHAYKYTCCKQQVKRSQGNCTEFPHYNKYTGLLQLFKISGFIFLPSACKIKLLQADKASRFTQVPHYSLLFSKLQPHQRA